MEAGKTRTGEIVWVVFALIVVAIVVWQALPALDAYTSARLVPGNILTAEEVVPEAEAPAEPDDSNSLFRQITIENETQAAILEVLRKKWPENKPPWEHGYQGLCETWVWDVYNKAGLPTAGSCCASASRDEIATWSEDIPAGALIYSGPEYSSGFLCEECGRDPGHVAIYLGDGKVAGSQSQYILSLDEYKEVFGYGGWYFGGKRQ